MGNEILQVIELDSTICCDTQNCDTDLNVLPPEYHSFSAIVLLVHGDIDTLWFIVDFYLIVPFGQHCRIITILSVVYAQESARHAYLIPVFDTTHAKSPEEGNDFQQVHPDNVVMIVVVFTLIGCSHCSFDILLFPFRIVLGPLAFPL